MPISSAEVAQQSMAMQQQFRMMNSSYNAADDMAGDIINTIGASARPMASGAAGLLGATPEAVFMGAGLNAGISAFSGGAGIAGAIGAGVATGAMVAAPVMLGGAALSAGAQWVGHNLMQGAQDQQRLNVAMRQSYGGFYNQEGGRGFTRTQLGQIGSEMREMTHQVGPGGELTSMKELTELAAKMGQMGMGRGVRDAQEFNKKFREMVKVVKEVATEMNTSLGQALEFMQASKASGMFTTTDQARFAKTVQSTATGSGLATSEVTAMASIGSQISRSVGGLGRQGALGGARAIGQIGAAVQSGALSEEDIYNATGLAGAEGRQALATNMMSQTGKFLKSGKGRYLLAALAGKDGTIDEEAAQRFMTGNVGTGETRQLAGQHLGEIGRANFIRNEGRLRGAVMERFGAMAPAIALKGWASQRGIDINEMDDRSMLFAQRQLGMGRDELDAAMKMAQRLPEIARQQIGAQRDAEHAQAIGMDLKQRGIEGLKRRFDKAKEDINSKLQAAGQSIFTETSEYVDRWLNKAMGHTVAATTDNIGELYRSTLLGGHAMQERSRALFGGWDKGGSAGQKMLKEWDRQLGEKGGTGGLGGGPKGMTWEEFSPKRDFWATVGETASSGAKVGAVAGLGVGAVAGATMGGIVGAAKFVGGAAADWAMGAGRQRERLEKAGFDFSKIEGMAPGEERDKALRQKINTISSLHQVLGGEGPVGEMEMSPYLRTKVLESYASGELSRASTEDRPKAFRALLEQEAKSNPDAAKKLQDFDKAGPTGQMLMVARAEEGIGKKSGSVRESIQKMGDPVSMLLNRGQYATMGEADEAYGRAMLGKRDRGFLESIGRGEGFTYVREKLGGGVIGHVAAGALKGATIGALAGMGLASIPGAITGAAIGGLQGFAKWTWGGGREEKERERAVGEAARSEKGMQLVSDILEMKEGGKDRALEVLADREKGKALSGMQEVAAGALLADKIRTMGGPGKMSDEDKAKVVQQAKDFGMTDVKDFDDVRGRVQSGIKGFVDKQKVNNERITSEVLAAAKGEFKRGVGSGVLDVDEKTGTYKLSSATEKELKKLGTAGATAMSVGKEYMDIQNKFVQAQKLRNEGNEQGAQDLLNEAMGQRQKFFGERLTRDTDAQGKIRYRSVEEQTAIAKGLRGTEAGDYMEYEISMGKRLSSLSKKGGMGAGIARYMGADLSKGDVADLQKAFGKGEGAYGEELGRKLHLSSSARAEMMESKDFKDMMTAAKAGGGVGASDAARLIEGLKQKGGKLGEELKEGEKRREDPQTKMVNALEKVAKALDPDKKKGEAAGLASQISESLVGALTKTPLVVRMEK